MSLNINDIIGFAGVFILLLAFLLNLAGKISKNGLPYILMNTLGAGIACLASWLINYLPFIILEGIWMSVSLIALINYFTKKQ